MVTLEDSIQFHIKSNDYKRLKLKVGLYSNITFGQCLLYTKCVQLVSRCNTVAIRNAKSHIHSEILA